MREEFTNSELWTSRGFIPHYDASNKFQMITYRLADSLPKYKVSDELQIEKWKGDFTSGSTASRRLCSRNMKRNRYGKLNIGIVL